MKQPQLVSSNLSGTVSTKMANKRGERIHYCSTPERKGTYSETEPHQFAVVPFLLYQFLRLLISPLRQIKSGK